MTRRFSWGKLVDFIFLNTKLKGNPCILFFFLFFLPSSRTSATSSLRRAINRSYKCTAGSSRPECGCSLGTAYSQVGYDARGSSQRESRHARVAAPCRLSCTARSSSYRHSRRTGTVLARGIQYTEFRLSRRYRLRARHFPAAGQGSGGGQKHACRPHIVAHFLRRHNRCARDVPLATDS